MTTHDPAGEGTVEPMCLRLPTGLWRRALAAAVAAAALVSAAVVVAPAPAQAASGFAVECDSATTSCITFSGYQGRSVWKYPVNRTGNNCVNYVAYRLSRNGVRPLEFMGNGGSWASSARKRGLRVNHTPTVGSIAQWSYGSAYAPGYGHVGYVEEVSSTWITVSDSSWSGGSRRWRVARGNRNWPSAFIHAKDQTYQPPPANSFVRVRETGTVYRLVGKAPVAVTTWRAFGGKAKATHTLSAASLATLPRRVADGTFLRAAQTGQVYRVAGGAPVHVKSIRSLGRTTAPTTTVDQAAIDRAGSSPTFSRLFFRPATGSFLRSGTSPTVYRMSGGYAYRITSWAQVGGRKTYVTVDPAALAHASTRGPLPWRHISGLRKL